MRATMSMKPGPQDALTPPGHAFMALQTAVGWPPIAITGAGGYFGAAGEAIVCEDLHTGRRQQTPTAPYPAGALCCNSGRGVAIGTAIEIVALQHQHSGVHQGRTGAGLSVKVITVRYHVLPGCRSRPGGTHRR
jgi:hypothetical protein